MAENPFRILLDFRELNFKFYKFVWMSILPRELVTIKDLKDAILKKFSFERTDLQLFLRDGLLPEDENISNILRENDSVRLFYANPSDLNLNDSINYEEIEPCTSDEQASSSKKRKMQTDASINLEENEQVKSNKKRKHSFSNGTYFFENNSTPENSALTNTVPDDTENVSVLNLSNFKNHHYESCKIKKKLKYTNDVSQNSLISENETFLSNDIIPRSEKNESKVNSCKKKKKKHKHSKDVSENEIILSNDIVSMNENEPRAHKKTKKLKYSHGASKSDSVSKNAVSFSNEILSIAEKLDDSVNNLSSFNNELSELKESVFETVTDHSEVLKQGPVSFCTTSVNTSSGIGSLKSSEENQNISAQKNCSVPDCKPDSELERSNLSGQGNSCKKKKRKRHRKRKSLLIDPQVDVSNDWNLDISTEKIENIDSSFTSTSYQTAEISPRNKEISDSYKSNLYLDERNANCSETKSIFLEPSRNRFPSTSTPFSKTNVVSSAYLRRNNVGFKFPSSSNVSQAQSCSVAITRNAAKEKMLEHDAPTSLSEENNKPKDKIEILKLDNEIKSEMYQDSAPNCRRELRSPNGLETLNTIIYTDEQSSREKQRRKKQELKQDPETKDKRVKQLANGNSSSDHSLPCSATKNTNKTTFSSHNFNTKSLSSEINHSPLKSTNAFPNKGIKNRFRGPKFSYEGCTPLNACPLVGTHIAYKVLELDATYSPVVSDYKEGLVKSINSQTDELEIELIEPEVKGGRTGKFENLYEDELPSCEVVEKVTLSWPSLINPVQVEYE